jgi:hypothetical protein
VENGADYYLNHLAKEIGYDSPVQQVALEALIRMIERGDREL